MKISLALVSIVAAFALSNAQSEGGWCRCAAFVSSRTMEIMVLELPEVPITDCMSHNQCKNRCVDEINTMTNEMDLWSTVNETTVGQVFCEELFSHGLFWIHNSYIHGYYEVCGGPWEYTGIDSQQMLCCTSSQQIHCVTK
ncbi:uncharacterized protein LOC127009701 [Eriocheir sinensis]|uniref:uncharacterized protein LOC127009701 n=1 Tax=Eriocheir sinensis TaxID=95602 RepID=UPI0021C5C066|nr:uncharacterized protein LOC127009701 [Eriocheir sinensis]